MTSPLHRIDNDTTLNDDAPDSPPTRSNAESSPDYKGITPRIPGENHKSPSPPLSRDVLLVHGGGDVLVHGGTPTLNMIPQPISAPPAPGPVVRLGDLPVNHEEVLENASRKEADAMDDDVHDDPITLPNPITKSSAWLKKYEEVDTDFHRKVYMEKVRSYKRNDTHYARLFGKIDGKFGKFIREYQKP